MSTVDVSVPWPILPLKNAVLFPHLLMPLAVRREIQSAEAHRILVRTTSLARELNGGVEKVLAAPAQMLAYLLDVCLFYLESNNGNADGDLVVQRYGKLIDSFAEWSAA